jgi:hypothetical protein
MVFFDATVQQNATEPAVRVLVSEAGTPKDLSDVTEARFRLRRVGDDDLLVDAEAQVVDPPTAGYVEYRWAIGDTQRAGVYEGQFVLDGQPTPKIVVWVEPDGSSDEYDPSITLTFATVADYERLFPGESIDASELVLAEIVISAKTARTPEAFIDLYPMDKYWLRLATCGQAKWMQGQPDYFTREAISSVNQSGASTSFAAEALELAPFARMCLRNLSWMSPNRSTRVGSHRDRYAYSPLRDVPEESPAWRRLPVWGN